MHLLVEIFDLGSIDEVQGVNDVSLRLGHLVSFRVAHHGVKEDFFEGRLVHEPAAHHQHTCHPEE